MPGEAGKLIKVFGMRAKLETTYAQGVVLAPTDAILLAENPIFKIGYAHDGTRALPPGTMGFQNRVAPSGRIAEGPLKFEPRGAGAAYSASVLPGVHTLLRAAGLDAVITTTLGLEKVAYTPTPGPQSFASVQLDLFSRGQQYSLNGVYGDMSFGAVGPTVPVLEIPIKGLVGGIAVSPGGSIGTLLTYGTQKDLLPPKAINMGFTYGAVASLKLKSWSLKLGRTSNQRLDQNAGGHAGFAISTRAPMFEFTIENEALTMIDPYTLRDGSTTAAIAFTLGGVQYNRIRFAAPAAQIVDISDETEDPTATIKVTCQLNPSAVGLTDEFSLTFD
jgi:hypothetical protein